jgi:hypothetical protein
MRALLRIAIAVSIAAMLPPCPSHAQDAASAKAFLTSIYQHYQNGAEDGSAGINIDGSRAALYYHSSLLALMRADVKANGPDNVPAIDFDPICGCQDWDGIWDLKIDVRIETPQRALASLSFALAPPKDRPKDATRKLVFTLVPEHGAWRIYDIRDESDPATTFSVRKLLQDDLASLHSNAAPKASPSPAPNTPPKPSH